MADNFRQFSGALALATNDQLAWCRRELDALTKSDRAAVDEGRYEDTQAEFEWRITPENDGTQSLWIHSDSAGNVEHAAAFVQRFLRKFDPGSSWWLSWADTCSKPRVNEFSGGAVFVTADVVQYIEAQDWARQLEAAFQKKRT